MKLDILKTTLIKNGEKVSGYNTRRRIGKCHNVTKDRGKEINQIENY